MIPLASSCGNRRQRNQVCTYFAEDWTRGAQRNPRARPLTSSAAGAGECDGQRLASLPEGGSGFSSLAFSPSGHILAIGGGNGNITLLRLDFTGLTPQFFTNLICGKAHGNMGSR